ncbi:hypothetical protein B0T26DRAFT_186481 [Lasiosphaeria miniovina]|uniref:Secreted protein n=1 Tax=Lasiosphaeria miniovina TaxID=1954250 RepID=A0AA40EAZ8_9PEZI|nr:uncharacterized protein B0T26DRAFT_186481 [Lasiosphaeria miniovina]KAK0728853.1 hypothetical protein B0T26DRAFT_186481 [Lasiosphaeria miniovina]
MTCQLGMAVALYGWQVWASPRVGCFRATLLTSRVPADGLRRSSRERCHIPAPVWHSSSGHFYLFKNLGFHLQPL